jgi:aspartate carbamoyltransferase catalytic subunit
MTILDHKESLKGLRAAIVGDISHSRVARSNVLLLTRMGAHVRVCGPPTLIPMGFEDYGVQVTYDLAEALRDADVVMMLRTQFERQREVFFPSIREYFRLYGLDAAKMQVARDDAIIMHPGPINRGIEIDPQLADGPYSVILDQVSNGVALRMALLFLILDGPEETEES